MHTLRRGGCAAATETQPFRGAHAEKASPGRFLRIGTTSMNRGKERESERKGFGKVKRMKIEKCVCCSSLSSVED
jgi:hypothetical protein